MVKNPAKTFSPTSQSGMGLVIYKKYLKQLQDGVFDKSVGWRKTVLRAFDAALTSTSTSNTTIYTNCQKATGLKVNSKFEIVPVDGSPAVEEVVAAKVAAPPVTVKTLKTLKKTIAMKGPYPKELELVPKQGPARPKPPTPPIATTAPASTPSTKPVATAKAAKSKQIHTDVIAACNSEISEAFNDLEELIDNVDRLGDDKTLKVFIRKTKAACKRMSDQLLAKTQIDKLQEKYVAP